MTKYRCCSSIAGLKFKPFRARWVASERWHPEQVSQYLPCGSYQLDVPYSEDCELIQDILKQGSDVDLLAPPALNLSARMTGNWR
uniref:hypothetical protein n=1 Tax=Orrella sp. TaxID=1921583 RepID=UPI0040482CFC